MADMERGNRVFAIRDLGGGWSSTVPKGTKGTVVGVESHVFSATDYTVRFDNGEIEQVTDKDIYPDEGN